MHFEDTLRLLELFKKYPVTAVVGAVIFAGLIIFFVVVVRKQK